MSDETPDEPAADLAALGRQLVEERKAAGLSRSEAARRSGIARATLISWEDGKRPATPDLLAKLRAVYAGAADDPPHGTSQDSEDDVPVSRYTLGLIRGRLETTVTWLGSIENQMGALGFSVRAIGETLTALRGTLDTATHGVAGLLSPDMLPQPERTMAPPAIETVRPETFPPGFLEAIARQVAALLAQKNAPGADDTGGASGAA